MPATIGRALLALLTGALGGALFNLLKTPLPWTLGSLTAAAVVAILLGREWTLPNPVRDVARPVVGVVAGSAFTMAVLHSAIGWWPAVLFAFGYTALIGVAGYWWFRLLGKFDHPTAFFSAMPAGLGELTLVGGSFGGDTGKLVIVHFVRIVTIVVVTPFALQLLLGHSLGTSGGAGNDIRSDGTDWLVLGLCAVAGFGLSRILPIPAGPMLYPLLLSAVVHATSLTAAAPPQWLIIAVQIVIGCVVGGRFAGISWTDARGTIVVAVGWSIMLLLTLAAGGWLLLGLVGGTLTSSLLSIAPGGMVEMTVLALALGDDTAFVVTLQTLRILLVITAAPLVFVLLSRPPTSP